jgi:hypothetical protein
MQKGNLALTKDTFNCYFCTKCIITPMTNFKIMRITFFIALAVVILAACNNQSGTSADSEQKLTKLMNKMNKANQRTAKVLEFLDAGTYTYVKLDENGKVFWAAITARPVEIGNTYIYVEGMMMKDFESKQLERIFDSVMFIQDFGDIQPGNKHEIARSAPHDHIKTEAQRGIQVERAINGKTIAEIFSGKETLNGKKVIVSGLVVKISKNIMKRNWIHIQDGTESEGNFDLTVTSVVPVDFEVGDVLTFEGVLSADKDFGSGYKYSVILEDAAWYRSKSL